MGKKFKVGEKLKASDFDKEQYGIEYVTITSINTKNSVYHWESTLNIFGDGIGKMSSGYLFKDAVKYDQK